jgi:hypothetical protein
MVLSQIDGKSNTISNLTLIVVLSRHIGICVALRFSRNATRVYLGHGATIYYIEKVGYGMEDSRSTSQNAKHYA